MPSGHFLHQSLLIQPDCLPLRRLLASPGCHVVSLGLSAASIEHVRQVSSHFDVTRHLLVATQKCLRNSDTANKARRWQPGPALTARPGPVTDIAMIN